jgi:membrane-associated phospholipid phosphatase
MPSAHVAGGAAFAVAASLCYPSATPALTAATVAVGWSRVALNRHFVTDVIAGAALGAAVGISIGLLARRTARCNNARARQRSLL